jgi:MSHA biogenesis protein MshQ
VTAVRGWRGRGRRWGAWCALMLLLAAVASGARADTPLALFKTFSGKVNFVGTELNMDKKGNGAGNSCGTMPSTAVLKGDLSGIPAGASILNAQLYWIGSGASPDYTIEFEHNGVTAPSGRRSTTAAAGGRSYFGGAADVTALVTGNGSYQFRGLSIDTGAPYCGSGGVLGGFALLVVYSHSAEPYRVLNLYEGFKSFLNSSLTLNTSNFTAPAGVASATGRVGHLTWLGDAAASGGGEQLQFNGVEMVDALNPSGNQFNSKSNINADASSAGIDFDAYLVSNAQVLAGAGSATTTYKTGADQVVLAAEIIAMPSMATADFAISMVRNTTLSPQQNASYTLVVTSNGPDIDPGPVQVSDTLPAGLTFVSAAGAGWSCGASGQLVTCTRSGAVNPSTALAPITLTVKVVGSGTITNSATVRATLQDTVPGNNSASDSASVGTTPYVFTDGPCLHNRAFSDPLQTCRPYPWSSVVAGVALPKLYVTALAGGVPTQFSATQDTTVPLQFALSCLNPTRNAGVQASYAGAVLPTCTANGAAPGSASADWSALAGMLFPQAIPSAQVSNFKYNDVGLVQLYLRDAGSVVSTGAPFVSKPAALKLSAYQGALANPAASDANGSRFVRAGSLFSMEAGAIASGGALTPNFGRETTPARLLVEMAAAPAGMAPGVLDGDFGALGASKPGAALGDAFSWSEVGILQFSVNLVGDDYLGGGAVTPGATDVGRFYPDHFVTTLEKAMNCMSNMGCPTNSSDPAYFDGAAYSGQPFKVTVTARNAGGDPTVNYAGAFARAVGLEAWDLPGSVVTRNPPAAPVGASLGGGALAASDFKLGVASTALPTYVLPPAPFSSAAPHALSLAAPASIYLRAVEGAGGDAVSSRRTAGSVEGGIRVVSGRLQLANVYGSELLKLPLTVHAQYWTGGAAGRWENTVSDNASVVLPAGTSYTNCQKLLRLNPPATTCKNVLAFASPAARTLGAGATTFLLAPPGGGNSGSVDILMNNPVWLPSTIGRAVFGVFASPLIYVRELY